MEATIVFSRFLPETTALRPYTNTDTGGEITKASFFSQGQPHIIMGSEQW
jgi:hypothetical protein